MQTINNNPIINKPSILGKIATKSTNVLANSNNTPSNLNASGNLQLSNLNASAMYAA